MAPMAEYNLGCPSMASITLHLQPTLIYKNAAEIGIVTPKGLGKYHKRGDSSHPG